MSDTRNTPEAPPPAAVPEDLEQRVQALLEEIDRTAARIEQAVADDERTANAVAAALGEPAPAPPPPPADPAPEAAEAHEPEAQAEPQPEPAPEPAAEAAEDELEAAEAPADPLVGAAADETIAPPPEPAHEEFSPPATSGASPGASAETLEDLDADLEEDLERLLAEERLAAAEGQAPDTYRAGVIPFSAPAAPPAPAPTPTPKVEAPQGDLEAELDNLMRDGEIGAPDAGSPADEPVSILDKQMRSLRDEDVDKEVPGSAPAGAAGRPQVFSDSTVAGFGLARSAVRELCSAVRRKGPLVAARAEPVAHGMASVVSRPLTRRSPRTRKVVGWLAVYTGFLAVCVWGYLLFFRATDTGAPTSDSPGIVGSADRTSGRARGAG